MEHVTQETLVKKHGEEKGIKAFAEIAVLGGFGDVGPGPGQIDPSAALDVRGALDPENKAVSQPNKNRIKELLGEAKEEPKK